MAPMRPAHVAFSTDIQSRRVPREDEADVMRIFARHATRCSACENPYLTFRNGGELCDRGHSYARDVAKYVYSKGGAPFSLIDRKDGERNEFELPVDFEVIRNLTKAFDRGMSLRTKGLRPVVSQDPNYYVKERRATKYYDENRGFGVEVTPASTRPSRREREHDQRDERERPRTTTTYQSNRDSRGSLYYQDEEAKQSRKQYEDPVVIIAEPRRRHRI